MHDFDLPLFLWGEESQIVVYIKNRSPHKFLEDMTLEEAFSKRKLEVGHMRIFGCSIYIHVTKDKRKKLETSRKKGIFVGYNESSNTYRVYIPKQ